MKRKVAFNPTYNPDRCEKKTELYPSELWVYAADDNGAITLRSNTNPNHSKVHDGQRP